MLGDLANSDRCRVVLLHHPPYDGASGWRKRLIDAGAFRAIVARHGADLILCGHAHTPLRSTVEGPHVAIPVLGVPSASSLDARPGRQAQYQIYEIMRDGSEWIVRCHAHAYDRCSARFLKLPVRALDPAPFASAQPC